MSNYTSTNVVHDGIVMTKYDNEPFVVGDYDHNQVEFLHLSHERWYIASPFLETGKNRLNETRIFGFSPVKVSESRQRWFDFDKHYQRLNIFEVKLNQKWTWYKVLRSLE